MQIDGYTPPDKEIGLTIGVEQEYPTKWGKIHIRILSTGKENIEFRKAADVLTTRNKAFAARGLEQDAEAGMRAFAELYYDHAIVSWDTTIKSGGKAIKPTRENFAELMSDDLTVNVFLALQADCNDADIFQRQAEGETIKN